MCDKMSISAYILKIVENDLFLRLRMRAKEMFNRHQFFLVPEGILPYQKKLGSRPRQKQIHLLSTKCGLIGTILFH